MPPNGARKGGKKRPVGGAATKQTAAKSTGGRAPRAELDRKAARRASATDDTWQDQRAIDKNRPAGVKIEGKVVEHVRMKVHRSDNLFEIFVKFFRAPNEVAILPRVCANVFGDYFVQYFRSLSNYEQRDVTLSDHDIRMLGLTDVCHLPPTAARLTKEQILDEGNNPDRISLAGIAYATRIDLPNLDHRKFFIGFESDFADAELPPAGGIVYGCKRVPCRADEAPKREDENWFPINVCTMRMYNLILSSRMYEDDPEEFPPDTTPLPASDPDAAPYVRQREVFDTNMYGDGEKLPTPVGSDGTRMNRHVHLALLDWLKAHPNEILVFARANSRERSVRTQQHLLASLPNHYTDRTDMGICIRRALQSAMYAACGSPEAVAESLSRDYADTISFGRVAKHFTEKLGRIWRLSRVKDSYGRDVLYTAAMRARGIDILPMLAPGQYVLHIEGRTADGDTVSHAVHVDTHRRVIFDCMENYAMPLSRTVIPLLVGDDAVMTEISELRQLSLVCDKRDVLPLLADNEKKKKSRGSRGGKNKKKNKGAGAAGPSTGH